VACRHDVQFTGADDNVVAQAVAVPNGTFEWPCNCLQADVRVGQDFHGNPIRPEAV
jgi:hypothetical protein